MDPIQRLRTYTDKLHNQIVLPLIAATALVGVVATVMGIFIITGIVEQWVDQSAESRVQFLETRFKSVRESTLAATRVLATEESLASAGPSDEDGALQQLLWEMLPALGVDDVMLLDEEGRVVAAAGDLGAIPGTTPFPEEVTSWQEVGRATYATQTQAGGHGTVTAYRAVDSSDLWIAASTIIDSDFLTQAGVQTGNAYCYLSGSGECLATTASEYGNSELDPQTWLDTPAFAAAVNSGEPGRISIEIDGRPYRVRSEPLVLQGDPIESRGYLVGVVDSSVADATGRTTVRLIVFWSVVAIMGLWGLGHLVARRVSSPIVGLTESARHIAEGDYSRRVPKKGSNELGQLAVAFNDMTDSLRERNESLTKKVLELATLYEMSRLLGGTLELGQLLDSVLDAALRIFDVEAGYVILREKETGDLHTVAWRGTEAERPGDADLRSSISEWVVREGRPLIFNPTRGGHEPVRVDTVIGATTALCVPLISNEGSIGAITVGSKDRSVRFDGDDVRLLSTVANHATIAIGNIELFSSLQDAYLATVRSLAAAVDAKDAYTRGHSDRVAIFAMTIAEHMDLSADQMRTLEMAAYLHDIGKIGVREAILLKPGKLDAEEMGQMRHHPLIGASILKPVVFPWPVAPIIRHHHEHWDGSGYPAGLRREEIPLLARILTVADAYEAMTSDRPYRLSRGKQEAVAELQRCSGSHFDPAIVDVFLKALQTMEPQLEEEYRLLGSQVQRDEARAVFAAVCDGMFTSFRRLGGPRLAANVEHDLNKLFDEMSLPASYAGGRVFFRWDDRKSFDDEMDELRSIVGLICDSMGHYAGGTLVDHFFREALAELSGRLRMAAATLDFRPKV